MICLCVCMAYTYLFLCCWICTKVITLPPTINFTYYLATFTSTSWQHIFWTEFLFFFKIRYGWLVMNSEWLRKITRNHPDIHYAIVGPMIISVFMRICSIYLPICFYFYTADCEVGTIPRWYHYSLPLTINR